MAATVSCVMAMGRIGQSRPGSDGEWCRGRHLRMWLLLWWVLPLLTGAARNFATELPELLQPRPARLASRLPTRPQKSDHLS